MPRRIEIELTSHAAGVWTWRAAGAKQPKGAVDDSMVPEGSSTGDVLRAEIESGLDGIDIVSLERKAPKVESAPVDRIEVLGAPRREPGVSVLYAPGGGRKEGRGDRDRGDRPEGRPRRSGGTATEGGPSPRGERRPRRTGGGRGAESQGRRRPGGERPDRTGPGSGADVRRERRPTVSTQFRNAMLATLGPEQLPVAEQLLRGGIPAVRKAIAEQEATHRGVPVNAVGLLSIAEQLLPAVNLASWKDRAAAAQLEGEKLLLRDLRAVVTASRTVNLDDEGRAMARALREVQEKRVSAIRDEWLRSIESAIEGGRVVDALHTVQHPPEPGTRLPAELAVRLAEAAGAAMTATTPGPEWLSLLDATVESPVRRTVKPAGIPDTPVAREAARHAAGLVPELAKLLGLRIPPPPPRRTVVRRTPVSRSSGGGSAAAL
jgi:hypothetical protein